MKNKCSFCSKTKAKKARGWFIFRGEECCDVCRKFLLTEDGGKYLQYRSEQEVQSITPMMWLQLRIDKKLKRRKKMKEKRELRTAIDEVLEINDSGGLDSNGDLIMEIVVEAGNRKKVIETSLKTMIQLWREIGIVISEMGVALSEEQLEQIVDELSVDGIIT